MNCGMYRGAKLIEHARNVLENVLEERLIRVIRIDDMQFGFVPHRG